MIRIGNAEVETVRRSANEPTFDLAGDGLCRAHERICPRSKAPGRFAQRQAFVLRGPDNAFCMPFVTVQRQVADVRERSIEFILPKVMIVEGTTQLNKGLAQIELSILLFLDRACSFVGIRDDRDQTRQDNDVVRVPPKCRSTALYVGIIFASLLETFRIA